MIMKRLGRGGVCFLLVWLGGSVLWGSACGRLPTPTPVPQTPDISATETVIAARVIATIATSARDLERTPTTDVRVPSITSTPKPSTTFTKIASRSTTTPSLKATSSPASRSTGGNLIAYVADSDSGHSCDYWSRSQYAVWLVSTDGTGNRLLMENATDPSFLPNGQILLTFHSRSESWLGVYGSIPTIVDFDGNSIRQMNPSGFQDRSVSRDGRQIVAVQGGTLVKMNLDSSDNAVLVGSMLNRNFYAPDWSHDGQRIAFRMCMGRTCGIAAIPSGGGSPNHLTTDDGKDPSWSPDSRSIAYWNNDGLWIVDAYGTNKRRLLSSKGNVGLPRWSADGRIYYLSPAGGAGWGIYSIEPSGGAERLIINVPVGCNWSEQRFAVSR